MTFSQFIQYVKDRFYAFGRFVKRNPFLTAAIIGLLIGATIFTGGAILFPVAIATMAWIGTIVGGTISGMVLGSIAANMSDGNGAVGLLVGVGTFVGIAFALSLSPIAGAVVCGIAAVSLFASLCGVIGSWIASCFNSNSRERVQQIESGSVRSDLTGPSIKPASEHTKVKTPSNSNTHIPGGLSVPGVDEQSQSDASSTKQSPTDTTHSSDNAIGGPARVVTPRITVFQADVPVILINPPVSTQAIQRPSAEVRRLLPSEAEDRSSRDRSPMRPGMSAGTVS